MSLFQSIQIQGVELRGLMGQPTQAFPNQFGHVAQWNITCHPDIKPILANIASYIYNYIAQRATMNLPRAVHYNMMVVQGNPELLILTTLVANMAYIRVQQGQMNINDAVSQCTDWAVTRRVNYITINVPDLFNQMQSEAASIQQMANEYVMEINTTLQAMSQIYMGGTAGFSGQRQQQQNNGGMSIGGFSTGPATGFGNANNNSGGFAGTGAPATGFGNTHSAQGGGGGVIVRSMDTNAPRGDRFSDDLGMGVTDAQPKTAQVPAQAPVEQRASVLEQMERGLDASTVKPVQVETKGEVLDANGNLNWAGLAPVKGPWTQTRFQPHPVMFDSSKLEVNRRGFQLDGVNYIVDTMKKVTVDRKALSLPPAAQYLDGIKPADKSRAEFREESLVQAAAVVKTVRSLTQEAEYLERSEELRTNGHIVFKNPMTSLSEALTVARQAAMSFTKHEFGAYTAEFHMAKEFVVLKDDAKFLQELSKSRTLSSLVDAMSDVLQDPHASHSLRVAMTQLNYYLAQCWMEWLRFYICLDEFSGSNSFVDDVLPMRDEIGSIAGNHFRQLVDRNQQRFIQTYLAFGDAYEGNLDVLADPNKEEGEKRHVVTVPIMTPTMLVCTEFLDSEFALQSSGDLDGRDIGCNFDENTISKGFRALVQTMVEQPRSMGLQSQIRRFYISTLDGVVYEVNLGLNEQAAPLLIKKVR